MANLVNTLVSIKIYRDSAGIVYVRANSILENEILKVEVTGTGIEKLDESRSGKGEIVSSFNTLATSADITVQFVNLEEIDLGQFEIPKAAESLPQSNSQLTSNFNFDYDENLEVYSFTDSLFYSEGETFGALNIFPTSRNPHLDTSSDRDFYYTSTGNAAYIASNDLQNEFLNNIGYETRDSNPNTIGKFRGGQDYNSNLTFISSPADPDDIINNVEIRSPKVVGGIFAVVLKSGVEINNVCLDPAADNFYLKGCVGQSLPCTDSGTTHANDCDGVALTAQRLNSYTNVDGGCCTYTTGCADYNVTIDNVVAASPGLFDGSIAVTINGGTANFTITVDDITLVDATLTYNSGNINTISGISTTSYTITGLAAGTYDINVSDSTSGDACTDRIFGNVPEDGDVINTTYACKTDTSPSNTALNFNAAAAGTHSDAICVFCDAIKGTLISGAGGIMPNATLLGPAFNQAGSSVTTDATSNPSGVSQSDGTLSFPGIVLAGAYNIPGTVPAITIDPSTIFTTSNQATPYTYTLYKINSGYTFPPGDILKSDLTANASSVATADTANGGSHTFTGLQEGEYRILVQYDNDGTLDGDDEVEQCYLISHAEIVYQGGCTDPNASNYNVNANFDDGSCTYLTQTSHCGDMTLLPVIECDQGNTVVIRHYTNQFFASNPHIPNWQGGTLTYASAWGCVTQPITYPAATPEDLAMWMNYAVFCGDYIISGTAVVQPCENVPLEYSNGVAITSPTWKNPMELLILQSEVTFQDGTTFTPYASWPGQAVYRLFANNSHLDIAFPDCHLISDHGPVTHITFTVNYGYTAANPTYSDTWSQTYAFSAQEQALQTSCCPPPNPVPGCTDPTALNYNENCAGQNVQATVDDGCCIHQPPPVPGCTDPTATNYDPTATIDDGSCIYPQGSWFCTNVATSPAPGTNLPITSPCIYVFNDPTGYATQQICEDNCQPIVTDCIEMYDWTTLNTLSPSSTTNSTSTLNPTTGQCDTNNDGTWTITIPDATTLNATLTNDVYFSWFAWSNNANGDHFWRQSWASGLYSGSSAALTAAADDHDDPTIAVTGAQLLTDTYGNLVIDNLGNGTWYIEVFFWIDNLSYPTELGNNCGQLYTLNSINLDPCSGGCVYGCTDPMADNYDPNATCDDGTCVYPCSPCTGQCLCPDGTYDAACCPPNPPAGCTDPNAINYDPNAILDDGSCIYDPVGCVGPDCDGVTSVIPACIPKDYKAHLNYIQDCIARSGHRFYTKHITGMSEDCSTMETWKLIIIHDLLSRLGLPCIYNCQDETTPSITDATFDCQAEWVAQGSNYWNPTTAPTFQLGDVVKRSNGGLGGVLYVAVSNSGLTVDPYTQSSSVTSGWKLCTTLLPGDTTNKNYLENFLTFARSYCRDCGIPPYRIERNKFSSTTPQLNIGGSNITNNGATFTP